MTLVDSYYWSQIALAVIAGLAAFGAYYQIQTFKRFELLKLFESPHVKLAQQRLFLADKTMSGVRWWSFQDKASTKTLNSRLLLSRAPSI